MAGASSKTSEVSGMGGPVGSTEGQLSGLDVHAAANRGDIDKLRAVLTAAPDLVDRPDELAFSALMHAGRDNRTAVAQVLLNYGARVNFQSNSDKSALMLAAIEGHVDMIRLLLDNNADPLLGDRAGSMAIHFAADFGHAPVVQLLLERGVSPNERDGKGWTPLHRCASLGGSAEVVKVLAHHGATVDAMEPNGNTPLIAATVSNRLQAVKELLKQGADPYLKSRTGNSARQIALNMRRSALAALLPEDS